MGRFIIRNTGKLLHESEFDVTISTFRYYAGLIMIPNGQSYSVKDPSVGIVVRKPIGVCGQIILWSFPILMAAWKIATCLAAGNVTVFKPSEITPLTAIKLFEFIDEVVSPKGVISSNRLFLRIRNLI